MDSAPLAEHIGDRIRFVVTCPCGWAASSPSVDEASALGTLHENEGCDGHA